MDEDDIDRGRREFLLLSVAASVAAGCAGDALPGETGGTEGGTSGGSGDEAPGTDEATSAVGDGDGDGDGAEIPFDPTEIPEDLDVFPRTVLAGDMTTSSVVFAIFVADLAPKTFRLWRPGGTPGSVILVDERTVTPDADGFVKERIDALTAGTWYTYGFFAGDEASGFTARSLIGWVQTLHAPGTMEPVTIAFGSCVGRGTVLPDYVNPNDIQPFDWDLTDMAATLSWDLFVHLGDQGYMDQVYGAGGSYQQYLAAWGAYHGGGFRRIYPKAGMVSTWDDHEVTDNGTVDPWTGDPTEQARIDNAMRAYYRVMPIDGDHPSTKKIWRSFIWGDTVEVVLLDCRYERTPDPNLQMMSPEQMDYLLDRLENSPCRFVCVCTDKPFANIQLLLGEYPGQEERWQGHDASRQQVTDLINDAALTRVIFVTGDIHMNYVGTLEESDASVAGQLIECCLTSGNTNPLEATLSNQQFAWHAGPPHFPLLTFDAVNDQILVQYYAEDGSLSHEQTLQY
jgi:hypothetical protein